jgi:hypothetical protein
MNVDLIRMSPEEAQHRLSEYRAELHRANDAEYAAIAQGLEALAEGTPILSLTRAIQAGGFDEQMRPRLAIARADRKQVKFEWHNGQRAVFDTSRAQSQATSTLAIPVDMGREHGRKHPTQGWGLTVRGFALVPMIPPKVRRVARVRPSYDSRHFILFEVEQWSDTRISAQPDRDPYLLRHLGGDAYAVLAEWDLTPLEQMVMAGRAGAS